MEAKRQAADATRQARDIPPEWQVTVRRVTKEDGRYLIYYEFAPAPAAPEIELQPAEEAAR